MINQELRVALYDAIMAQSKEDVQRVVETNGLSCEALDRLLLPLEGSTPLTLATTSGTLEIVQVLLDAGSDPLIRRKGDSPIHIAAQVGRPAIAAELIKRGVSVELESSDKCRPLFIAAENGCLKVARVLLEAGADIEFRHEGFFTSLYIAAQSGRTNVVVELLKHGAYTGPQGRYGGTPLIQSAHRGYLEIVLALLRRGCSPNTKNHQGCTALHLAASTNQVDVVKALLTYGADVDIADRINKATPVMMAYFERRAEAAFVLTGWRPNSIERVERDLRLCVLDNDAAGAAGLLEGGAFPDPLDDDGLTPIQRAVLNSSPRVVEVLLRGGADGSAVLPACHTRGKEGVTPLALTLKRLKRRVNRASFVDEAAVLRRRVRVRDALLRTGAFRGGPWRWPDLDAAGVGKGGDDGDGGDGGDGDGKDGHGRDGDAKGGTKVGGRKGAKVAKLVRLGKRDSRTAMKMMVAATDRYVSKSICDEDYL